MNISGIRPISGFYSDRSHIQSVQSVDTQSLEVNNAEVSDKESGTFLSISDEGRGKAFGSYDVVRQHKPLDGIKAAGVDKVFSQAEVAKAVDTMKRDGVLHKYQTFVGAAPKKEPLIRSHEMENFTL